MRDGGNDAVGGVARRAVGLIGAIARPGVGAADVEVESRGTIVGITARVPC